MPFHIQTLAMDYAKYLKPFEQLQSLELTMGCGLVCDDCTWMWDCTAAVNAFVRTITGLPHLDHLVL